MCHPLKIKTIILLLFYITALLCSSVKQQLTEKTLTDVTDIAQCICTHCIDKDLVLDPSIVVLRPHPYKLLDMVYLGEIKLCNIVIYSSSSSDDVRCKCSAY